MLLAGLHSVLLKGLWDVASGSVSIYCMPAARPWLHEAVSGGVDKGGTGTAVPGWPGVTLPLGGKEGLLFAKASTIPLVQQVTMGVGAVSPGPRLPL